MPYINDNPQSDTSANQATNTSSSGTETAQQNPITTLAGGESRVSPEARAANRARARNRQQQVVANRGGQEQQQGPTGAGASEGAGGAGASGGGSGWTYQCSERKRGQGAVEAERHDLFLVHGGYGVFCFSCLFRSMSLDRRKDGMTGEWKGTEWCDRLHHRVYLILWVQ